VDKGSFFPASLPACIAVCVVDDSHSNWNEVESRTSLSSHSHATMICISKDAERFLIYSLAICTSFELFSSFDHSFTDLLILCGVSFFSPLCILIISPLSNVYRQRFSLIL
jgi:hypothetical protein